MKLKEIWKKVEEQFILWLARSLPDCRYMTAHYSDALERPPNLQTRATMRLHLYTCGACRRYVEQIKAMHESLIKNEPPEGIIALSNEARERIKAALVAASRKS